MTRIAVLWSSKTYIGPHANLDINKTELKAERPNYPGFLNTHLSISAPSPSICATNPSSLICRHATSSFAAPPSPTITVASNLNSLARSSHPPIDIVLFFFRDFDGSVECFRRLGFLVARFSDRKSLDLAVTGGDSWGSDQWGIRLG
ncbi:unnamed protein product, partial [Cuscuta epithymum]